MDMPLSDQELEQLIQLYSDEQAILCSTIAGIMILAYDYFLTLPAEIEYIWKRRRTFPAVLFLILRYLPVIQMFFCTSTFVSGIFKVIPCEAVLRLANVINDIMVILIGGTMALRLMALYNWNKSAMPALLALLIGQTITLFVFTGEVKFTPIAKGAPCVVKSKATFLSVVWLCPLTVDTILKLCGLTNYRIYELRKLYSQMSPLLLMLRRDGILYYGVICSTYAASIINYYSNPNQSKGAGTIISMTLPAVMICRLILNLQELPSSSSTEEQDEYNSSVGVLTTYLSHPGSSMNNRSPFFEEHWGVLRCDHVES